MNWKGLTALVARLVLAWVFIRASLPKVQDPVAFATSIEGFRIVSGSTALWVAVALPWLEIFISIGLLTPWLSQASAWLMTVLLCAFIALHGSAWARGLDITCGCFGENASSPAYHWLILRNLLLVSTAVFILQWDLRNKRTTRNSL